MSKRKRRVFSTDEKVAILKRHLVDKVAVSDLCEEYKIQPSVFYSWQSHLFEHMAAVFQATGEKQRGPSREKQLETKVENLEAKLAKKDSVIAEISAEFVQSKKELGEL